MQNMFIFCISSEVNLGYVSLYSSWIRHCRRCKPASLELTSSFAVQCCCCNRIHGTTPCSQPLCAVCRPPQISDSWHMHPRQRHWQIPEPTCVLYSSMMIRGVVRHVVAAYWVPSLVFPLSLTAGCKLTLDTEPCRPILASVLVCRSPCASTATVLSSCSHAPLCTNNPWQLPADKIRCCQSIRPVLLRVPATINPC